jgi:hypothetical protein
MMYDLVIIGGGPAGLAVAQCCSKYAKNILILEKESSIGGCHRVRRVDKYFTEHGPRVYSDSYMVFKSLLSDVDLDFYELFKPYNFSFLQIGGETIWTALNWRELFTLVQDFTIMLLNPDHGKNMTMKQYVTTNNFSAKASDMLDRLCRITDGADLAKYTLKEFLELGNQQVLYSLYQPKTPNDKGFLMLWKQALEKRGVTITTNADVQRINTNAGTVSSIDVIINGTPTNIQSNKIVCAVPPKHLVNILSKCETSVQNAFVPFDDLKSFATKTAYNEYLSMTFHWDKPLSLDNIYGFPKTTWGLVFIKLSDYMHFDESGTVISLAITITDRVGDFIRKTPNECTKEELFTEVQFQLKQSFPDLPVPSKTLMSPGVVYKDNKWVSLDTAYIASAGFESLPFAGTIKELYNVGTHNGKHKYAFTSLESAVTNAVILSRSLYPELKETFPIQSPFSVRDLIVVIILILILYFIIA